MKNLFNVFFICFITVLAIFSNSISFSQQQKSIIEVEYSDILKNINTNKSESEAELSITNFQNNRIIKEKLNSLKDENGNNIIPARQINHEDAQSDSLIQTGLTGTATGDQFGYSVASAGDVNGDGVEDLIIGAPFNDAVAANAGRAYIYFGSAVLNTVADVVLTGVSSNDNFGISVASAGDVNGDGFADVIVGAKGNNSNRGRAYIYFGGVIMNNVVDVILTGEAANNYFGNSVAGAGDVNGDGFADVFVGAYGFSTSTGRAYIYLGGSSMDSSADVTITGASANDNFGFSVSGAGNVNNDSYSDVIVGAYGYSSSKGRSYIYYGGAVMNNVADAVLTGASSNDNFGYSVSKAGNVNNDGYADVIIGAKGYSTNTGRAYIYYGGAAMDTTVDVTLTGAATNNYFGTSVASAGDIDGDGISDVIVGASGYSTNTGRAYTYYGGVAMNNVADDILTGEAANNFYGFSVGSIGDMDADGYSDLIVGAYGNNASTGKGYFVSNKIKYVEIVELYVKGKNPIDYGCQDTLTIVIRKNTDFRETVIVNVYVSNSNIYSEQLTLSIGVHLIKIPLICPPGIKFDNIIVEALPGLYDNPGFLSDVDSMSYCQYTTLGVYNYADPCELDTTGYGFPGTSGNIVSRFNNYSASVFPLYAVDHTFYNNIGSGSQPYKIVIYNDNGSGKPGTALYTSATLTSPAGSGLPQYVTHQLPSVLNIAAGSRFYVGIKQTSTTNIKAGVQTENPVRKSSFFLSSPESSTSWFDFDSLGINYRLDISPRAEAGLTSILYIEGFYNASSNTMVPDTVRIYLRNINTPYSIIDSSKALLNTYGRGEFSFKNSLSVAYYYIQIIHRNSIQTWNSNPILFVTGHALYDFSNNITKAFGSNMIQIDNSPLKFGFYSGDVNQDGTVDAADLSEVDNDAATGTSGYMITDLNGDDFVDGSDLALVDNNASIVVVAITP